MLRTVGTGGPCAPSGVLRPRKSPGTSRWMYPVPAPPGAANTVQTGRGTCAPCPCLRGGAPSTAYCAHARPTAQHTPRAPQANNLAPVRGVGACSIQYSSLSTGSPSHRFLGQPLLILQVTTLPAAHLALFLLLCLPARFLDPFRLSTLDSRLFLFSKTQIQIRQTKSPARRLSASRSTETCNLQSIAQPNRSLASPLSANLPSHQKRIAGSSVELRTTDEEIRPLHHTHHAIYVALSSPQPQTTFFPRHFPRR